jgi:hypothetical protein
MYSAVIPCSVWWMAFAEATIRCSQRSTLHAIETYPCRIPNEASPCCLKCVIVAESPMGSLAHIPVAWQGDSHRLRIPVASALPIYQLHVRGLGSVFEMTTQQASERVTKCLHPCGFWCFAENMSRELSTGNSLHLGLVTRERKPRPGSYYG